MDFKVLKLGRMYIEMGTIQRYFITLLDHDIKIRLSTGPPHICHLLISNCSFKSECEKVKTVKVPVLN